MHFTECIYKPSQANSCWWIVAGNSPTGWAWMKRDPRATPTMPADNVDMQSTIDGWKRSRRWSHRSWPPGYWSWHRRYFHRLSAGIVERRWGEGKGSGGRSRYLGRVAGVEMGDERRRERESGGRWERERRRKDVKWDGDNYHEKWGERKWVVRWENFVWR